MVNARFSARTAALGVALAFMLGAPALAQEPSKSHVQAAIAAVKSAKASSNFDALLPALAERIKNQLIRIRPDLYKQITEVVDQVALKLVARRAELDTTIAKIWAKSFTEEELNAITAFYSSPAGAKFGEIGPNVLSETFQAAKAWSDRVGEELLDQSRGELKKLGVEF